MLTETDVDYILSTFEISEKASRKVRYIVDSELKQIGFPHFDLLYRRIADLVEVYAHGHYEERFMVRLDQKKSPDDNRTLHDLLGRNDENFIQIEGDDSSSTEDHRGRISLGDAVDMLFGELPPEEAELLRQLSKNSSEEDLFLSEQEVLGFVPKVREGLHKLLHEYGKDGRLLIPRRPIVEVKWDPNLRVKFGKRKFKGNPLQFFEDNIEVYGRMGRKQLQRFDESLYQALRNAGQLSDAIPDSLNYKSLRTPEHFIRKVIEVYPIFEGSIKTAARAMGHSEYVFRKYWHRNGFTTRPTGGHDYDLWKGSRGGIDYGYLGEAMAKRMKKRGLIQEKNMVIGGIVIKPGDSLDYDDACDHFGILSGEELDDLIKDKSYLLRGVGEHRIDRLSALYLAALSPTIGLRSVAYNLVAVVLGISLDETDKILNNGGIIRNPDFGYPDYLLRKRIFNPTFGFALKHLDIW